MLDGHLPAGVAEEAPEEGRAGGHRDDAEENGRRVGAVLSGVVVSSCPQRDV